MQVDILNQLRNICHKCNRCHSNINHQHKFNSYLPFQTYDLVIVCEYIDENSINSGYITYHRSHHSISSALLTYNRDYNDVYITNAAKCATNNDEWYDYAVTCTDILKCEIDAINPLIVVTMGPRLAGLLCDNSSSESIGQYIWSDALCRRVLVSTMSHDKRFVSHIGIALNAIDHYNCPF